MLLHQKLRNLSKRFLLIPALSCAFVVCASLVPIRKQVSNLTNEQKTAQIIPNQTLKNVVLGDARRRGETHQWVYDRINLKSILIDELGFKEVHTQDYNTSLIPNWNEYGLDVDEIGMQYKPESLYIEAVK